MDQVIEAIYQNGVLMPLESPKLADNQRVTIVIRELPDEDPDQALQAWHEVYAGLTEEEIDEMQRIVLDRSHFMKEDQ